MRCESLNCNNIVRFPLQVADHINAKSPLIQRIHNFMFHFLASCGLFLMKGMPACAATLPVGTAIVAGAIILYGSTSLLKAILEVAAQKLQKPAQP